MHNKKGIVFMITGIALVASALLLLLYNRIEDINAGQASAAVLPHLQRAITYQHPNDTEYMKSFDAGDYEMTVTEIDGYGYIGYLTIPVLEMELPIMSEWDDERLKIAPCRHFGSAKSDDLVIAGHNYIRHFGPLSLLQEGDLVLFTDMDGVVNTYKVEALEVLMPNDVEAVKNGGYDLTLYTCVYTGQTRLVIFCERFV